RPWTHIRGRLVVSFGNADCTLPRSLEFGDVSWTSGHWRGRRVAGVCQSRRDVGAGESPNTRDRHLQQGLQFGWGDGTAPGRSHYVALGLARLIRCHGRVGIRLGFGVSVLQVVASEDGTDGPQAGIHERERAMDGIASLPADLGGVFLPISRGS